MSNTSYSIHEPLRIYIKELAESRESETSKAIRAETVHLPEAQMQITTEQAQIMKVLVQMLGAKNCIEVGVFTGYSALAVAEVLPDDGFVLGCDISDEWTDMAKRHWSNSPHGKKIELQIGRASETLQTRIDMGEAGKYDFAFIDADKSGYPDYYEKCLTLIRSGGLIAFDNAFMGGRVVDPQDDATAAIDVRELTEKVYADERVEPALFPVGDGVLLVLKK